MSMIGNLARLPANTCEALHRQPELITALLYPEMASTATPQASGGFLGRLFGKNKPTAPSPAPKPTTEPLKNEDRTDLDKAWHVLHFLFTGSDWEGDFPQGFLVSCGKPIGDVDVGYGPARSFTPEEVQKIATFLDAQTEASLKAHVDWKKMEELDIYPSIWTEERKQDWDDEWEYFLENFRTVKQFVKATAERKLALLIYLN